MLRIVPISNSDRYTHLIDAKIDGKRKRIFFASEKEAKAEFKRLELSLRQIGEKGLHLSSEDHALTVKASELLRPFDKNILDAARFYTQYLRSLASDEQVAHRVEEYIEIKRQARFSKVYIQDIKQRLARFNDFFGSRQLKSVSSGEIEQWLHGLRLAPLSINNYRAVIRAFFGFAVKRDWLASNPVASIDKIRSGENAPEIFTPEELNRFLDAAPYSLLPSLVLGAFAGLRVSEVLRLNWTDIDRARGLIHIASTKTKSARRRLVKIQPTLEVWLQPFTEMDGKIFAGEKRTYHYAIDELVRRVGLKWPRNGLRHSFASYHLAKFQNAPELALQLGHSTTRLIFEHYRELVIPQAAAHYWAIQPTGTPSNVVPLAGRAAR